MSSTWERISSICSGVITGFPPSDRPSSISVSARATQSLLQVENFLSWEKTRCISSLAYRSESGLSYLSVPIAPLP